MTRAPVDAHLVRFVFLVATEAHVVVRRINLDPAGHA
jgi:hypothetical protein